MFRAVIAALEARLEQVEAGLAAPASRRQTVRVKGPAGAMGSVLDRFDLTKALSREEYETKLGKRQGELRDLEYQIYRRRIPVVIAFEGWDAAGKGGNIRRLTQKLDPRGYEVVPVSAPSDTEKAHHYLWRFWTHMPKGGHITIFDRTWYGRVLVERVEGFCTPEDWQRAYHEINEMEEHLAGFGAVIVKFWLHIDRAEQIRRFRERERLEYKQWKITPEDWRNREKWDLYHAAVDEMLVRTSTAHAPWTVVEANCKFFGRIKVLDTVIAAMKQRLKSRG
jgi:polyphosphate kinase 2 (PPK2 family)